MKADQKQNLNNPHNSYTSLQHKLLLSALALGLTTGSPLMGSDTKTDSKKPVTQKVTQKSLNSSSNKQLTISEKEAAKGKVLQKKTILKYIGSADGSENVQDTLIAPKGNALDDAFKEISGVEVAKRKKGDQKEEQKVEKKERETKKLPLGKGN